MAKKQKKRKYKLVGFLIILILFFFAISILLVSNKNLNYQNFEEMKKVNVKYLNNTAKIILENECYKLTFYTSKEQGRNIEVALANLKLERPLTHDLFISVFKTFKLNVKELRITKLENGIYYANLIFDNFFSYTSIDLRPSDGVAIALRGKIPIFVKKNLTKNKCINKVL